MRRIITFIIMLMSFMAVFGISFKIFDKKLDNEPKEVDFSTLTYVALGDSITEAMDGIDGQKIMSKPYCKIVGDILGLQKVKNYGISGTTIAVIICVSRVVISLCVNVIRTWTMRILFQCLVVSMII